MIPSVLSRQVRQGIHDFLQTTFPVSTPLFADMLGRLLREDGAVFKGPYLSVDLPFVRGDSAAKHFDSIDLGFVPYLHQQRAFARLAGARPRSTLVATGTGSGKTECFLYPILDHCLRHREQRGVKAIIIYPMNALATDQAQRMARAIDGDPALKGKVTAGLFIGQSDATPTKTMSASGVITCKTTQRLSPPDILLTNYKMLDYMLVRPKDQVLWQHNGPETLRYLVVDELHTFDGAQGTDLACLLRRLKDRLKARRGDICCVGTSATLGGPDSLGELRAYANQIFDERFDEGSVITEARQSPGEFLADSMVERLDLPRPDQTLSPDSHDSEQAFVSALHAAWFGEAIDAPSYGRPEWRLELARRLKVHLLFHNLLKALGQGATPIDDVIKRLSTGSPGLKDLPPAQAGELLLGLLSLISVAREDDGSGRLRPFLNVRVQLWLRELRRMVASVSATPRLRFADDLNDHQARTHLPVVHCRDCGAMGWAGTKKTHDSLVHSDIQRFYIAYFGNSPTTVFMFPESDAEDTREIEALPSQICPSCMNLVARRDDDTCPECGESGSIAVLVPSSRVKRRGRFVGVHDCPYCGAGNGLSIVGSRAASLTSVLVAQLFSSGYNDDKKLLTFSDSVQDAAHRAGFFAARTYRFNLRAALQQFVQAHLGESGAPPLSLDRVAPAFCEHWRARLGDLGFVATFLAPNMTWLQDYNELLASGELPEDSNLVDEVAQRVGWEIFSEYGFNCRIGRSLEKTSSSVVGPEPKLLDRLCRDLLPSLQNEIGPLRTLDLTGLRRFVLGLIGHLKNQGGVFHPVLRGYVEDKANTWLLNKIRWMARFNPYGRAPAFLSGKPIQRFDTVVNPSVRSPTWAQLWAEKCLSALDVTISPEIPALYELVLPALVEAGLLAEVAQGADRVWGLDPSHLRLSLDVQQLRCQRCGHNVSVPDHETEDWVDTPCLRFHCRGHYAAEGERGDDYYGKLYATGDVQRVFTAEHTGLLSREEREELERQFKMDRAQRKPWYPNLLSCTPTLEMGIDIGDLSSLILCSVPPRQSSYVQRTGRAGRRDGNALNLTVANARPHDLFFFAQPSEMIAGQVDPPGVFLGASAVLERQLVAFCFDRWAQSGIDQKAIPPRLSVVLGQLDPVDEARFPHSLVHFIDVHRSEILQRFVRLFAIDDARMVTHLTEFIEGDREAQGSLCFRILDGLRRVHRQKTSLEGKVKLLTGRIKKKQESPAKDNNSDDELRELKREKSGLQSLAISLGKRDVLNFFTDEGLLPNYAFPEAGVSLRSVIYRRRAKPKAGESAYENFVFDYERSAGSAISELAPANTFYAGGRKVKIDQVDMASSEIETWRLCRDCSHAELMGEGEPQSTCPRCGDTLWSDEGRKVQMLRMRQVFATTSDRDSRIADDSDDREPAFYNKQMLADVDPGHITRAFAIDDESLPFGFEFLSRATFREINFGEKGDSGPDLCVAGVDIPRQGFKICAVCGKVQKKNPKQDDKPEHSYTCTSRRPDAPDTLIDCVYLYRHFGSEAIRILLPVTTFAGSDEKLHSFIAALHLGLKRRFGGNIDHLQTAVQDEPVAGSNYRKRYLLLYDTVPGGTGYLKQLMLSPAELMEVFGRALEHMNACSCQHDQAKDGCYRCLYAYRHSYDMKQTSRGAAVGLFSEILKRQDAIKEVETLAGVQVNSLFDSELEARFVEALRRAGGTGAKIKLKKDVVHGKPGYFLSCGEQSYYIEPQVPVGSADGVSVASKIDFVLWPAKHSSRRRAIAVFTDGFAWHKDRVGLDLAQRMALVQSARFWVWSLTYQDVENCFKNQGSYFDNDLAPDLAMAPYVEHFELADARGLEKQSSFEWLVRYLCQPDDALWRRLAFVQGLLKLQAGPCATPGQRQKWESSISACLPAHLYDELSPLAQDTLLGALRRPDKDPYLQMHLAVPPAAVSGSDLEQLRVACWLDDGPDMLARKDFASIWNGVLRLYNLFQFLPRSVFVTATGLGLDAYQELSINETGAAAGDEADLVWRDLRDFSAPALRPLIDALQSGESLAPEIPTYEIQNKRGAVVAEAELAWPAERLAVLVEPQMSGRAQFEKAGWTVVSATDALADPKAFVRDHAPRRP